MAIYQFAIASGWNVPLVSLTNVENLPQQGIYKFPPPSIVPGYDDGSEKATGDGGLFLEGYPFIPWFMHNFRYPLWNYLFTTINSGLRRNQVTINTLTRPGSSSYSRLNVWMHLSKPQRGAPDFNLLPNYTILMLRPTTAS